MISSIKYVIPARKGSKGLPLKNRKLLQYTIKTIPRKEKKHIIITTDDPYIKQIAKKDDIKCTNRPPKLASDIASMKNVLMNLSTRFKLEPTDIIVLLYLTYPQRTWHDIEFAMLYFHEQRARSLLCSMEPKTHPYMCVYKNGRQVVKHNLYLRQDYPECMEISHYIGIFYVSEIPKLNLNLYNDDTIYYKIKRTIDIDTEEELNEYSALHNA